MKTNQSVGLNPPLATNSGFAYNYGISPVSLPRASANAQPQYSFKLDLLQMGGSTSAHKEPIPPAIKSSPLSLVTGDSLSSQELSTPATNSNGEQGFLAVILQYPIHQLANPTVPVVFIGTVGLVFVAILISLLSRGIRVKLDLDVSLSPKR